MNNMFDLHHKSTAVTALKSAAIITDTTTVGEVIDTKDFKGLEFVFLTGTYTDGTYLIDLYEDDAVGMGTETIVSATEMLGDISITAGSDTVFRVGYIGKKRYVRAKVVSTLTTTGVSMLSGVALKVNPNHQPTDDQN